jgi:hypothetical protein
MQTPLVVFQPAKQSDLLMVGHKSIILEEYRKQLSELDKAENTAFLWSLRFALLQTGVWFHIERPADPPESIEFQEPLYSDGLTKSNLMKACSAIHRAALLARWKFAQKFGKEPPFESNQYR